MFARMYHMQTTCHMMPAKLCPQLTNKVELGGCRQSGQGHHAGTGPQLRELRTLYGKLPCIWQCSSVVFCMGRIALGLKACNVQAAPLVCSSCSGVACCASNMPSHYWP